MGESAKMNHKFLLLILALLAMTTTACSMKEADANIVTEAASVEWTEVEVQKVGTKVNDLESRTNQLQKEINALLAANGGTKPTPQPPADGLKFKDVTEQYWAYKEIMSLYQSGLISGYADVQLFKPEQSITRAQAASMLVKALKIPLSDSASEFTDVKDDMWAKKAIMTVAEKGYFKGSNGKFMPNEPMKRKHMAVVLQRAFELKPTSASYEDYKDVPKTDDGYNYIKALSQNGIATGSEGKFMPYEPTKRSQFSVFLYRALQK
jgi:hypothetical protein